MNKPTSARDEAEKVFSGFYTGACNVDAITKALERAERRGVVKGLHLAAKDADEHAAGQRGLRPITPETFAKATAYAIIGKVHAEKADRLESELNTEPGEGSKTC